MSGLMIYMIGLLRHVWVPHLTVHQVVVKLAQERSQEQEDFELRQLSARAHVSPETEHFGTNLVRSGGRWSTASCKHRRALFLSFTPLHKAEGAEPGGSSRNWCQFYVFSVELGAERQVLLCHLPITLQAAQAGMKPRFRL